MIPNAVDITLAPLVPWPVAAVLIALAACVVLLALFRRARGSALRGVVMALLAVALLNPTLVGERREPRDDVALLVVDRSASQSIGDRSAQTDEAVTVLRDRLERIEGLQVETITVTDGGAAAGRDGTQLMTAVRDALRDIPERRLAGVVAVTDGQVHDTEQADPVNYPFHTLLTGEREAADRRLQVDRRLQLPRPRSYLSSRCWRLSSVRQATASTPMLL